MPKFIDDWRKALRSGSFRDQLVVSVLALAVVLVLLGAFLEYIGARMGAVLHDPLLDLYPPAKLTFITFTVVYAGFVLGLFSLIASPYSLLLALRAILVLIILRAICQFFLPLDPPPNAIPLADPFFKAPGFREAPVRDLFFSWHTAILSLLVYVSRWRDLKIIFASITLVVSVLMLAQHAHYTIDLVAAPCFAYASYGLARWVSVSEVAAPPRL